MCHRCACLSLAAFVLYVVSLCVGHVNRDWFLLDIARLNPYKLVYKVTKFSCQHKVPIQRSAFTFCEDEIPSGLDLGKAKYGGPFTTEQVEDVKAEGLLWDTESAACNGTSVLPAGS